MGEDQRWLQEGLSRKLGYATVVCCFLVFEDYVVSVEVNDEVSGSGCDFAVTCEEVKSTVIENVFCLTVFFDDFGRKTLCPSHGCRGAAYDHFSCSPSIALIFEIIDPHRSLRAASHVCAWSYSCLCAV